MEHFAKIINDLKPLTIFAKSYILDVWQVPGYASAILFHWILYTQHLESNLRTRTHACLVLEENASRKVGKGLGESIQLIFWKS